MRGESVFLHDVYFSLCPCCISIVFILARFLWRSTHFHPSVFSTQHHDNIFVNIAPALSRSSPSLLIYRSQYGGRIFLILARLWCVVVIFLFFLASLYPGCSGNEQLICITAKHDVTDFGKYALRCLMKILQLWLKTVKPSALIEAV